MYRIFFFIFIFSAIFALFISDVQAAVSGDLIKLVCTGDNGAICKTVYYLGEDGKRYSFPNKKIFDSWYDDFSGVSEINSSEMASYLLGGNVTYRPGKRMLKIATDPKVYLVDKNGVLRWITSEAVAASFYGADTWQFLIDDIPDAFFSSYTIGEPIYSRDDFDLDGVGATVTSINHDKGFVALPEAEPTPEPTVETPSCTSNSSPVFTYDIAVMNRVLQITPPYPGTHHAHVWNIGATEEAVYAPVDMTLSSGAFYTEQGIEQYIIIFQVSCEVNIKFDHIKDPIQAIKDVLPATARPTNDTRTEAVATELNFKAGDLVGYTTGTLVAHNWDFGVYNTTMNTSDNATCGFDYFGQEKKNKYYSLFVSDGSTLYCNTGGEE